jgi:hypothetical protein
MGSNSNRSHLFSILFSFYKIESKFYEKECRTMNYELKHIHGIPYYLDGTTVRTLELDNGKPASTCLPIGPYDATSDSITYFPDWRERVQPRLDAFRAALTSQARDTLRDSIVKPQKPRKATRNPRKPASRAKNPESV